MRHPIVRTFKLTLIIGLCFGAIYSQSTSTSTPARYATVNAVLENTSNKSVLIWATGNAPKTLADTSKFRVAPGTKKGLVVTVPANGQVKFTASAGPTPDKSDILGATLGTCIWRQESNTPNKVPYVVYNGSGLTCGTTTK